MASRVKCLKIFFKHTWHPQQIEGKMDGVVNYKAGETEFGEIKIIVPSSSLDPGPVTAATTTTTTDGSMVPCRSGVCKSGRDRTELRPESPWHGLKTIFLVTVIVALVLWVIVYALLAQYEIL